ncbi:MAG: hypothetical protein NZM31_04655 [Gemmatales bacterium]|nr:hypothetical protein [Gemmatales bacterium]MDW8386291.1 hypothetical protein [Gemmatales bacterium]
MEQEQIWQLAWQRAIGLTLLHMLIPVVGCYIGLLVAFYLQREWSAAILCTFCLVVTAALPVGILIALGIGWLRASRWQIQSFMVVWTFLVVLLALDVAAALILRDLDGATVQWLFAPRR